jgi:fluoride exporter
VGVVQLPGINQGARGARRIESLQSGIDRSDQPCGTPLGCCDSPWLSYVFVGIGGFLGANARLVVAQAIGTAVSTRFPLGTFVINIVGSFLLGVLGTLVPQRMSPGSEGLRLALGVGFLGAFTTFSTLEFESHTLLEGGEFFLAMLNMIGSLVVGLVAVRLGIVIARAWLA